MGRIRVSRNVRMLTREAARYSAQSDQDANPSIALVHATYGKAYVQAARKMVGNDGTLSRLTRIDPAALNHMCTIQQQRALKNMNDLCVAGDKVMNVGTNAAHVTGWLVD